MYFYTITSFSQLLSTAIALDTADLAELSSDVTYTVFAAPNSAFNALPEGLFAKLLDPVWKPQLQDVSISSKQDVSLSILLLSRSHVTVSLIYGSFHLGQVLLYHVLGLEVRLTDIFDGLTATTLNGEEITISTDPLRINDNSNILVDDGLGDIDANNGVIHGIDSVLIPTSVSSNIIDIAVGDGRFSTLVAAVTAAGLDEVLTGEGPFTVFGKWHDV